MLLRMAGADVVRVYGQLNRACRAVFLEHLRRPYSKVRVTGTFLRSDDADGERRALAFIERHRPSAVRLYEKQILMLQNPESVRSLFVTSFFNFDARRLKGLTGLRELTLAPVRVRYGLEFDFKHLPQTLMRLHVQVDVPWGQKTIDLRELRCLKEVALWLEGSPEGGPTVLFPAGIENVRLHWTHWDTRWDTLRMNLQECLGLRALDVDWLGEVCTDTRATGVGVPGVVDLRGHRQLRSVALNACCGVPLLSEVTQLRLYGMLYDGAVLPIPPSVQDVWLEEFDCFPVVVTLETCGPVRVHAETDDVCVVVVDRRPQQGMVEEGI